MPHLKGVSNKSDREILSQLLENKRGLSVTDLQERTRLNKTTIAARLNILEQQGKIIRAPVKGKHGHHKRCYIPWVQYEKIYYQIHGKLSPELLQAKKEIEDWSKEKFGPTDVTVTKDLKFVVTLKDKNSAKEYRDRAIFTSKTIFSDEFEDFLKKHPWINKLPSDEYVMGLYVQWRKGRLCPDCLENSNLSSLTKDDKRNEYICTQCGATFRPDDLPSP